jgi:glycerate 2-kinase
VAVNVTDASHAARSRCRDDALAIFRAAVERVDPARLVATHLQRDGREVVLSVDSRVVDRWTGPTLVIGGGKAAARMAAGSESIVGAENIRGTVVVADGYGVPLSSISVVEAGHPLPDERGENGARRLLDLVTQRWPQRILCLISGGASALLACPRSPVTLSDKIAVTQLLLESGASIDEFNTVRKHLSEIKGGGLLRDAQVPMVGLLISDVVGDDPSTIGSGPTAADPTTFADAEAILRRYALLERVPRSVRELLEQGMAGRVPDTVKPGSGAARRCRNFVVGSNRVALAGAAEAAHVAGWTLHLETEPIVGDTAAAAVRFAARLHALASDADHAPRCVLAGGETTVRVRGSGRGGRNQEFALTLAEAIAGTEIVVLSAGTDGIDGPTDAAGAFVDGTTLARARDRGLSPEAALAANDSYTFFAALGDLLRCGPTGTNVMDIKIALVPPGRVGPG